MDRRDKEQQYYDYLKIFESTDIFAKLQIIDELSRSLMIFRGNANDLRSRIFWASEQRGSFWEIELAGQRKRYYEEVVRLFHNFVASSRSLIDHTLRVKDKACSEKLKLEYEAKAKDQLRNDLIINIVRKLREYFQHYKIPSIGGSYHVGVGKSPSHVMSLSIAELLEWKEYKSKGGWSEVEKSFLKKRGEYLNISWLINEYESRITDFYSWFYSRVSEDFQKEYAELVGNYVRIQRGFPSIVHENFRLFLKHNFESIHDVETLKILLSHYYIVHSFILQNFFNQLQEKDIETLSSELVKFMRCYIKMDEPSEKYLVQKIVEFKTKSENTSMNSDFDSK